MDLGSDWLWPVLIALACLAAAILTRSHDRPTAWDCEQIRRETRTFDHTECDMIETRKP